MSGYLSRLVERASPPAVSVPTPTAAPAVLDDPFEAVVEPLAAPPASAPPQITDRQAVVPAATVVYPRQTRAIRVTSGQVRMPPARPEVRGMPQEERRDVRAEMKPGTSPGPRYAPPGSMGDTADEESRSLAPPEPAKNEAMPSARSSDHDRELALAMADRFMASMRARTSIEPEMRPAPQEPAREPLPPAPREMIPTVERELAPPSAPAREAHPQVSSPADLPQPAGAGAWIGSLSVEVAAPPPERPVTPAPAPQGRTIVVGAGRKPGGRLRSFSRFQLGQV